MVNYWSKREWLLRLAKKMKLQVPLSISEDDLARLIDSQPATAAQFHYLSEFLGDKISKLPPKLTYGQARQAIEAVKDNLNEYAIRALSLEEGCVRQWGEHYYFVFKIYGSARAYRVVVQKVDLERPTGAARAILKPKGDKRTINPYKMLYVSMPVDLDAWQPTEAKVNLTTSPTSNFL